MQKQPAKDANLAGKFADVVAKDVDGQSKFFLMRYVLDFQGRFEEILDLAEEFKKSCNDERNSAKAKDKELDEFMAHYFLERKCETLTVVELRNYIKEIDLDKNHCVSFIEYAVWKYKKNISRSI